MDMVTEEAANAGSMLHTERREYAAQGSAKPVRHGATAGGGVIVVASVHHTLTGAAMFLTIALVLVVLWALGFFLYPIGGGLIHILLVIAIIAIIWHFVKGRGTTRV